MQKFKIYFWKYIPKGYFKEIREKHKARKNDYMNIYVCDNREEMYNLADKLEGNKLERDYAGRTWSYDRNYYDIKTGEYVKTSPCCGHIVFNKEDFYMNSITHEVGHAVIGYFNRKLRDCQGIFTKIDDEGNILDSEYIPEKDLEELFCYMLGNMADQIVYKYKDDGEEVDK